MDPTATLQVDQPTADDGYVNQGQLWCTVSVSYTSSSGPPPVSPPTCKSNSPYCLPTGYDTLTGVKG